MVENEQKSSSSETSNDQSAAVKPRRKFRALIILAEGIVILGVLIVLAVIGLVWRVHDAPLDVSFAKPRVEQALSAPEEGRLVTIENIQLHWPDLRGPLLLGLEKLALRNGQGREIASVDEAAIGLIKRRLLFGQVAPRILILKKPALRIVRDEGGDIDVGFDVGDADDEAQEEQEDVVETILSYVSQTEEPNDEASVLSHLTAFKIEQASVVFEGRKNGIDVSLPSFDILFSNPDHSSRTELVVSASEGSFKYEGVYSDALPFKDVSLQAVYDAHTKSLSLSQAHITAHDVTIKAVADVRHSEVAAGGALKILIDEVRQEQIRPLWPETLESENSFKWIVERMSDGVFHNATAEMKLVAERRDEGWFFDAEDLIARWDFENLTVNYRDPLPAVKQAKGRGVFDNRQEKLDVYIDDGKIGGLDVTKAELEFANIIAAGKGKADINIKLNGPLREVLDYVSQEPIEAQHDFDLAQVNGKVDAAVNIVFPTVDDLKTKDVHVYVVGQADGVTLPGVVGALSLTGGPFKVKVKDNVLRINGKGLLDGQSVDARYETFLSSKGKAYKSRVNAKATATQVMREKLNIDLSDFLSGPAGVDVVYTEYHGGRSEAAIKVDLAPSTLFVTPFAYNKLPGVAGEAAFKTILQGGELKSVENLSASAPNFMLDKAQLAFRLVGKETELAGGKAEAFKINESAGKVEFEVLPDGQVKIVASGQVLDLRPFLDEEHEKDEVYTAPPMRISVDVDKMITEDDQFVRGGKLYVDIDDKGRFDQLEMDAIAGKGDIYLRYKPDDTGKRVFRLEADDAGATLRAFGMYDKIMGGKLSIYGEPIRGVFDRNLLGRAEITDFKVVKAPGLARLISAVSLSGVASMLEGEGLGFAKLEANFDWLYRPKGSLLVLKDGRTSGNSLGLTFDGTFDSEKHFVDVTGTIVPLSGINKAIGSIPLVGDILTGGGALIAATYTFKGPSDDPKVSVNPLSVLTPGILRKILFE